MTIHSQQVDEALDFHKRNLDDATFIRWKRRLPKQLEALKRLPKLARAIAEEAEQLAAEQPAKEAA